MVVIAVDWVVLFDLIVFSSCCCDCFRCCILLFMELLPFVRSATFKDQDRSAVAFVTFVKRLSSRSINDGMESNSSFVVLIDFDLDVVVRGCDFDNDVWNR